MSYWVADWLIGRLIASVGSTTGRAGWWSVGCTICRQRHAARTSVWSADVNFGRQQYRIYTESSLLPQIVQGVGFLPSRSEPVLAQKLLWPGQLVCMKGLLERHSESTHGRGFDEGERCNAVWERRGTDPFGQNGLTGFSPSRRAHNRASAFSRCAGGGREKLKCLFTDAPKI